MTSVLITGAAGFLGSHLCENYLNKNYTVIGVDNYCTGQKVNTDFLKATWPTNYHFIESDISESWKFLNSVPDKIFDSLKYVFHFASPASPIHYQRLALETLWANTKGLQSALHLADKHNAKVIFASSSEVYGDPKISPQPEAYWGHVNSFGERSCYDEAKRFGEALIYAHNRKMNTRHGLVRIFNTYGPRMNPNDGRVVINFILQALKNEPLTIYGDGKQTRSFCYVSDLIDGIEKYAASTCCTPINLGNDREFTIRQLAELVIKSIGSESKLSYSHLPSDDPAQRRPDLTAAHSNLKGWNARISLEDGINKMAAHLKNGPAINNL